MIVSNGYGKYGFDAYGGTVLKAEDMSYWMDSAQRTDPEGISFQLGEEIEQVEDGFFALVPTINELFILNPECNIIMSEETVNLFKKNRVLIRGRFNTAAERFAKEYGLKFLHSDVELAKAGDYHDAGGIDIITLRFYEDGNAYIHQNNLCTGSSAGWSGGGEMEFDLPSGFYKKMDAAAIAEKCWDSCQKEIVDNGILHKLLEQAKAKGGFLLK